MSLYNKFNKLNNTGTQILDSDTHEFVTQRLIGYFQKFATVHPAVYCQK